MREIKFRAWNGKELKQVDQITISEKAWNCENGYGVSIPYQPHIILMQYTGLKDKNGKEIYEGDVVNHDNSIYPCKIIFKRKIAQFMAKEILKDGNSGKVLQISEKKIIEVVGNIYENPELL